MSKVPCEVIQDLMPLYVDGLTNEVTDKVIEEHVENCDKCRKVLEMMRNGSDMEYVPDENEKQEIDFLKKNKKKNLRIILSSIGAAALIIAVVIFMRLYVVGQNIYGDWVLCNAKVKVNDRIIWSDGKEISQLASNVYETRHEYVGDMSANGNTASVLNLQSNLGDYTNELETESEPFEWKLFLSENISDTERTLKENDMESFAYIMIAVIDNLDKVTYEYTVNGIKTTKTIDTAMATEFYGKSIKDCGKNVRLLDELIDKTGLK